MTKAATKFLEDPSVTVVVKAINSRKVHHHRHGAEAGCLPADVADDGAAAHLDRRGSARVRGLQEDPDRSHRERPASVSYKFNYKDVSQGKNLKQNIELKPGDTVIVP